MAQQPVKTKQEQVVNNFLDSLADLLKDLTSLEVATFTTTEGITLPNIKSSLDDLSAANATLLLQAYSHLDLDQDTKIILPVKEVGDDLIVQQAILDIHEKHVTAALEQRSAMIGRMLEALTGVLKLIPGT